MPSSLAQTRQLQAVAQNESGAVVDVVPESWVWDSGIKALRSSVGANPPRLMISWIGRLIVHSQGVRSWGEGFFRARWFAARWKLP
jgi:hypothetical protein